MSSRRGFKFEEMKSKGETKTGESLELPNCSDLMELAIRHAKGDGVEKNVELAKALMVRSAETGTPDAQFSCGMELILGELIGKNEVEGRRWLESAAEQNHSGALFELGRRHIESKRNADLKESDVELLERAAQLGDSNALLLVGLILMDPTTPFRCEARGLSFLARAAELGNVRGQSLYGHNLIESSTDADKRIEGLQWFRKAAGSGNVDAQCVLGAMLANADYGSVNLDESISWLQKAVSAGSGEARAYLRRARMMRFPLWRWRSYVAWVFGYTFLIWHTLRFGFEFNLRHFGYYLLIVQTLAVGLVLGSWLFSLGRKNEDEHYSEVKIDVEELWRVFAAKPWAILAVAAEDGCFMLPLVYIGINPAAAALAALAFGFFHYPEKAALICLAISLADFFIALFVLPYGIWTVIAGHFTFDLVLFLLLAATKSINLSESSGKPKSAG